MGKRTVTATVGSAIAAAALCFGAAKASAQSIDVNPATITGAAGSNVTVTVTLTDPSATVVGTQNTLTFGAGALPVQKTVGGHQKPDCTVNPAINKNDGTQFGLQPPTCTGNACTGVKAIVISFSDTTTPIPSGSVLYTCNVSIDGSATGSITITNTGAQGSNSSGGTVTLAGNGGTITVGGTPVATATGGTGATATATGGTGATATATGGTVATATRTSGGPTATATSGGPTATRTSGTPGGTPTSGTPSGSATATRTGGTPAGTGTATLTPVGSRTVASGGNFNDSDGCSIGANAGGSLGWLLVPAAAFVLIRRKRR